MNVSDIFKKIEECDKPQQLLFDYLSELSKRAPMLPEQNTSILAHLFIKLSKNHADFLDIIKKIDLEVIGPELRKLISLLQSNANSSFPTESKIFSSTALNDKDIDLIVELSLAKEGPFNRLTFILVLIKFYGLSDIDTKKLSKAMATKGDIYDYRSAEQLDFKKLIRRYPTGAVSEKIALVMPSLLRCFSKKQTFVSPFLVAKSLGFTGGTWDKLSTILGFKFPYPGKQSIDILKNGGVCMTVTIGNFNPSDKLIYKLRSLTNTVDSLPLIISSIASKQLSNPVDYLLLDIRYGANAFLSTIESAHNFFEKISPILEAEGIHTTAEFTNTETIVGSTIGNLVEVLEAIALMKNKSFFGELNFSRTHIDKQRDLIFSLTCDLLSSVTDDDRGEIEKQCFEFLNSGDLFSNFTELLTDHQVDDKVIDELKSETYFFTKKIKKREIRSAQSGNIKSFDQRAIGNFVNFELNNPKITLDGEKNGGIVLLKHEDDFVEKHDIIAYVFSDLDYTMNDELFNLFIIWKENY